MSKQALEWIVGKIVLDASFREALLAAPDPALAGFDLFESEKAWIKAIDLETMEALAHTLAHCLERSARHPGGHFQNLSRMEERNDV
jgi:hypothetical protein